MLGEHNVLRAELTALLVVALHGNNTQVVTDSATVAKGWKAIMHGLPTADVYLEGTCGDLWQHVVVHCGGKASGVSWVPARCTEEQYKQRGLAEEDRIGNLHADEAAKAAVQGLRAPVQLRELLGRHKRLQQVAMRIIAATQVAVLAQRPRARGRDTAAKTRKRREPRLPPGLQPQAKRRTLAAAPLRQPVAEFHAALVQVASLQPAQGHSFEIAAGPWQPGGALAAAPPGL